MDRLFLDANVLFSAAYGSQGLLQFWKLARKKAVLLLTSTYAVEEARRNLDRPDQERRLRKLLVDVTIVAETGPEISCPVSLPEKDRPVLLAAIQARATHFVTGDIRHFGPYRLRQVGGVLICTPRDYLNQLELPQTDIPGVCQPKT